MGENLTIFTAVEDEIISARKKGTALCDLTPEEFDVSLTGIIFQVSVICGCQLPTHEAHINALEKEFGIFLKDNGYYGLTTEEILTAFRMNANFKLQDKVETYSAVFNIDFASKVLRQYLKPRSEIDRKAINVFYQRDVETELNVFSDKRRKKIVAQFEKFVVDKNAELDLSDCFMQLREDDAFSNKVINDEISYQAGTSELNRFFLDMANLDEKFDREKKMVRFLFENMVKSGRLKIYDENLKLIHPGFELPQNMFNKKSEIIDDF